MSDVTKLNCMKDIGAGLVLGFVLKQGSVVEFDLSMAILIGDFLDNGWRQGRVCGGWLP